MVCLIPFKVILQQNILMILSYHIIGGCRGDLDWASDSSVTDNPQTLYILLQHTLNLYNMLLHQLSGNGSQYCRLISFHVSWSSPCCLVPIALLTYDLYAMAWNSGGCSTSHTPTSGDYLSLGLSWIADFWDQLPLWSWPSCVSILQV
jgi:hypothetical protein